MNFPLLYHRAKTGALHQWEVSTDGDKVIVQHGQVGGVLMTATTVATPKNIGRSNETTAEQQAEIEAQALHTFKLARAYSLTPSEAKETVLLPMLAHPMAKYEHKITYPVDVQPKLDGVRCLARWNPEGTKVVLTSRGGKEWKVTQHINKALESILPHDAVFDGEIYLHGKTFQWITARTKKKQAGTELLAYCVYDMPEVDGQDDLPWSERRRVLESIEFSGPILHVPTCIAFSRPEVKAFHDQHISEGYEGAIVRTLGGLYEYGFRSQGLLKLKEFDDGEFTIVGYKHGEGIEEDLVIWRCKNDNNDLEFDTRPKGTHDDRKKLLLTAKSFLGHKLKVRFFGRCDGTNLPRFPIGEGIRAEEDMDQTVSNRTRGQE